MKMIKTVYGDDCPFDDEITLNLKPILSDIERARAYLKDHDEIGSVQIYKVQVIGKDYQHNINYISVFRHSITYMLHCKSNPMIFAEYLEE